MNEDDLAKELFEQEERIVRIPIYDVRHYYKRGPFMLPEFWVPVWDFGIFVLIGLSILAVLGLIAWFT